MAIPPFTKKGNIINLKKFLVNLKIVVDNLIDNDYHYQCKDYSFSAKRV